MSDGLTVDTGAMRAHAGAVARIAAEIEEAAGAARTVAVPDDSFGLLCAFLVPPTLAVQGSGAAGVSAASAATSGIATGLTATADTYDTVDEAIRTALARLAEVLP